MPKFSHGFLKALLQRVVCWVPCSSSWVSLSGRSVECFMFCGFARAAKLSPERSLSISTSTSAALSCSRGPSSPSVSCRQWSQLCGSLWKKKSPCGSPMARVHGRKPKISDFLWEILVRLTSSLCCFLGIVQRETIGVMVKMPMLIKPLGHHNLSLAEKPPAFGVRHKDR